MKRDGSAKVQSEYRKCEGKTFVTAGYPVCQKEFYRLLLIERYSDASLSGVRYARKVTPMSSITDDLNAISDRVFELEQENHQLRAEVERLSQPKITPEVTAFLDAMEPIIANEEKLIGRQENKHICALFRAIVR